MFRTSSFCTFGSCVEVGSTPDGTVVVRDTKDVHRRTSLRFTVEEWRAFVAAVEAGEFDAGGPAL